ncbi:Helix-turn-helix domain-containing protein [Flavisolibacter ginsengisoli DSM 18119]|uniref:Helix-turn-helix domain-containing protein n=2 Tax=Flavisolibacter TaxID=398041 RepID=A0A1M5EMC0_9BACT|nr:Helix-turn-helix domain-containing protein [Flavisolibacter ginsengisoli DSM 18119]
MQSIPAFSRICRTYKVTQVLVSKLFVQVYFRTTNDYFRMAVTGKLIYFERLNIKAIMMETAEPRVHQGRNVKRFREMCGLKQEALALELGADWNQKRISLLEAKEEIEPEILKQVADVLKMPVEAFTKLDDDGAFNIISNTFNSHDYSTSIGYRSSFNFNVADKWMEALEENKRLYERLLQSEREKVELLERLLNERK